MESTNDPRVLVEPDHGEYDTDILDVHLLEPDFDADETDEVDEVFEDDVEEGTNPDEAVDANPDEVTS